VYNLTQRRFVAPFENLTFLGLMMCRTRRGIDGDIEHGATIQAGVLAIDASAGWDRYDTLEVLKAINDLYEQLRIFQNLFQPSMKLSSKTRKGSRVMRHYDQPCTPWQRVLKSSGKPGEKTQTLKATFENTDPFELSRRIDQQLDALYGLARQRNGLLREKGPAKHLPKLEFQQAKTSFAITRLGVERLDFQ
jgi:hypothetical protein